MSYVIIMSWNLLVSSYELCILQNKLGQVSASLWIDIHWQPFITYSEAAVEVFFGKDALKICSKIIGKQPCRSVISVKLQSNFIEIALRRGYSPVNLLHFFKIFFLKTPLDSCFFIRPWNFETKQHLSEHSLSAVAR